MAMNGFSVRPFDRHWTNMIDQPDRTDGDGDGDDTDNDVFRSGSQSPKYTLPVMPDAKQRRATVSGGSPTSEHKSLIVEDPVIRPKSQFINKAEREAALAILATSEASLKASVSDNGEKGVEGERKGSEGVHNTSSESSCDHKRPSESEVEDSVFSSDKEDQGTPKQAPGEGKHQEFRVAKPTPVMLEPAPVTPTPTPSKSPLAKTLSSSSTTSSSSTLTNTGSSVSAGSSSVSDSVSSGRENLPSVKSPTGKMRPPSPVSAPPSRKKSSSSVSSEGRTDVSMKHVAVGESETRQKGVVPSPLAAEGVKSGVKVSSASAAGVSVSATSSVSTCGRNSQQEVLQTDVPNSRTESAAARDSLSGHPGTRPAEGASPRLSDLRKGEKSKPLVLEATGSTLDHRPHSVQHAIQTEVAMDTPHKDAPQLMKIKKLESPTASEAPAVLSEPKVKKRVEFSPDAKESSPPHQVSYTHIIAGGVVQKIPIESASTDSPPVKLRQKSGNRRLDRRVSCKDLGKGDCEGWLYKRKEKDHRLAKHWSKHWCVLKNFNLYYYKNKEELKAKGVIYLPAFQVSPATDLKTKKFPFKVHNAGTTFYFASERQDDMSKWMNKMGLAAISFDTSHVVTTGGFIKPEPRSNHLGMANAYYSESDEEVEDGSSQFGSALSLNSLSSLGNANAPQPSPPLFKRAVTSVSSDPGILAGGSPAPHASQQKQGAAGFKGDRGGGSRV